MVYELDAKYLSIVVPIYNEAESVALLVREVHAALDPTGLDYELVCVDDGSRDRSFELLAELAKNDSPQLRPDRGDASRHLGRAR
jgi:glycosyltransferase involved in cell wall biosynthesis